MSYLWDILVREAQAHCMWHTGAGEPFPDTQLKIAMQNTAYFDISYGPDYPFPPRNCEGFGEDDASPWLRES